MGCSQIYIQCSTLIHQCRHHRHHHGHHQRDLGVRALNEGRICSRLCLTIQDTHPLATLPRLSLSSSSSPPSPSLYIPSGSSKIKEYSKYPKRDYNCIFYFRSLSFVRSQDHSRVALFKARWCHFLGQTLTKEAQTPKQETDVSPSSVSSPLETIQFSQV